MQLQRPLVFALVTMLAGVLLVACGSNTAQEPQQTSHRQDTVEASQKQQDGSQDAQMRQSIEESLALLLTPAPAPTGASTLASTPPPVPLATLTPAPENVTLTIVDTDAAPGKQATLPVLLDTGGKAVRSVQVNLAYDGAKLTNPVGTKNSELLASWSFTSHSPHPGDLRLLAVNLAGNSEAFNGPIFTETFTIDATVPVGDVPISVEQEDVRDASSAKLDMSVIDGVVTVTP